MEEDGKTGWGVVLNGRGGVGDPGLGVAEAPVGALGPSPGRLTTSGSRGDGEGEVLNVIINSDEQKLQAHLQASRVKLRQV